MLWPLRFKTKLRRKHGRMTFGQWRELLDTSRCGFFHLARSAAMLPHRACAISVFNGVVMCSKRIIAHEPAKVLISIIHSHWPLAHFCQHNSSLISVCTWVSVTVAACVLWAFGVPSAWFLPFVKAFLCLSIKKYIDRAFHSPTRKTFPTKQKTPSRPAPHHQRLSFDGRSKLGIFESHSLLKQSIESLLDRRHHYSL